MIIVETDDLGLSGQLRMEERPAFVKMLRNIASGKVRAVIVANIDRFFRRKWNDEAEKFMQLCDTYEVKVIVPNPWRTGIDFVYDFSVKWHIDQFRRKCEEAWNYLESHVYGRMLAAQDELGRAGFWAGGNLPIGYIVDRREKVDGKRNPIYRTYVPYGPHAVIVRWLFDRYWELGGSVMALLTEIELREYLFPAFEEWVDEEIVAKTVYEEVLDAEGKVRGYKLKSDKGLRSLLSNPAYIGYWIYKDELISTDNHEPIVAYNRFYYAFNRISAVRLDGTPNEEVLERRQKYVKKHLSDQVAILKGHIRSHNPQQRINICTRPKDAGEKKGKAELYYGFYKRSHSSDKSVKYMISCADLDGIFLEHFIQRLQATGDFEDFLTQEDSEKAAHLQLQSDIERDIRAVQAVLARIEKQIATGELADAPRLLAIAKESYKTHSAELIRLQSRGDEVSKNTTQSQKRRTYRQMMHEAGEHWEEVVPHEEMPMVVDTFIEKVVVEPLAPHFYEMLIHWCDPEWGVDGLICYRDSNASVLWTEEELDLLKRRYRTATRRQLLEAFPTRGYKALVWQATKMGMSRSRHDRTYEGLPLSYCLLDWQIMQRYGVTEGELRAKKGGRLVALAK